MIDPAAHRDGQEFKVIAPQWNYGADLAKETFYRSVDHSGPIGAGARVASKQGTVFGCAG
jgi:hypothetical protein